MRVFVVGAGLRRPRHRDQARRARLSATSSSSTRATPSAAPGATTPTRAPPATCPASSTRSASRPTPTGRARSPRSRRSRPTSSASPASPVCSTGSASESPSRTPPGTRTSRCGGSAPTPATLTADVAGHRLRRALRAAPPRDRGHRLLRRRDLPLRPLEPRLRPDRQARRRDRHRRLGDPDRARDRQAGRPPRRLPAHRALGDAAQRPRLHRRSSASRFRHVPFVQRAYRTGIYWGRECFVPGFTVNPKLAAPAKKLALQQHRARHHRPCAAGSGHAELPDRLQAHPDLQRLLPRARPARRRPRHRRHRPRSRRPASSPPTAPSARSTRSSWPPASTPPSSRSPST